VTLPIIGLLLGIIIGVLTPISIPPAFAKYMSVALLASLDSVFGGLRSGLEDKFDNVIFVTGFFSNALLAALLVFMGDKLGLDLYYVALLAFGMRIFQNLAIIRRHFIKR
jgi:small basic protein